MTKIFYFSCFYLIFILFSRCKNNTFGKRCDLCQPGFWNYPKCERCDCNGKSDFCDSRSGKCFDCKEDTDENTNCKTCKLGFYGNPIIGIDIPCRPCPCPNAPESGIYHARGCQLNRRTNGPLCDCERGYIGERCDKCDAGYFGNPTALEGECRHCDCNGNVDFTDVDVCDSRDGRCLKCLHNTEGSWCERCKSGFFGDALKQSCKTCSCNPIGTNMTDQDNYCDRLTGQCRCLPG